MVQRIINLNPDIVVVERSVSRIAQDLLLGAGITLVHNVHHRSLERVARLTQGEILPSAGLLSCQSFVAAKCICFVLSHSPLFSPPVCHCVMR